MPIRRPYQRSRTVVGLDIEPGALSVAEVSVNGAVRVERAATSDLEHHVVRDGEVLDVEALTAAIKALWREHKGLGRTVRVGVANARIVVRTVLIPPVTDPGQMAAAVRHVAESELPMPLDTAVLDFQPLGVVDTPDGPRLRVVLVAARRDMVSAVLTAVRAAGLKAEGIDLAAFAMIRALGGTDPEGGLYLSVGGLANVAVVADGICSFTRVTGGGLEWLALELAERRGLTIEHARMWLRHVGLEADLADVDGDPEIVADARAVLSEGTRRLAGEVRASLEFHDTQAATDAQVDRIVVTGAATTIPGFVTTLQSELGLTVEARAVEGGRNLGGEVDLARMTVAAGLGVERVAA